MNETRAVKMVKVTKSICVGAVLMARIEKYRNSLPVPTPSFSSVLERLIAKGLDSVGA